MRHTQSVGYQPAQMRQFYMIPHPVPQENQRMSCQKVLKENQFQSFQPLPSAHLANPTVYMPFDITDINFHPSMYHSQYGNTYYRNLWLMYLVYMFVFLHSLHLLLLLHE